MFYDGVRKELRVIGRSRKAYAARRMLGLRFGSAIEQLSSNFFIGIGSALSPLHTENIVAEFFIDPSTGSDSNPGTSGSPWLTLDGAITNLRTTATWPTSGDVALRLRAGTYQAISTAAQTTEIYFTGATRKPLWNRWLIITPDTGVERSAVVIKPPSGATGAKNAIKTYHDGTTYFGAYVSLRNLTIDGGSTRVGNNDTIGIYVNQTPDFEIVDLEIKGLQAGDSGGASTKAQGIFADASSRRLKIHRNIVHDIGTTTGTINAQEHAIYSSAPGTEIASNIVYNCPNGFGIQIYSGSAIDHIKIVHNTIYASIEKSGIIVSGNGSHQRIMNNIVQDCTQYGLEFVPATFTGKNNFMNRNIFFSNTSGAKSHTQPVGWSVVNEGTGDPLLIAPPTDMEPDTGSPALDLSDILYTPSVDIFGTLRTTLGDIGAVEKNAGGSLLTQALTASLSFTGAQTRKVKKVLTGGLSFTTARTRKVKVVDTAAIGFTGGITKRAKKSLTGGLSFTGSLTRFKKILKSLTAVLSFTGAQTRKPKKALTGTLSFSSSQTRKVRVARSATLSFTGNLTSFKLYRKALTANLTFVTNQTKKVRRSQSAIISFTSSQSKRVRATDTANVGFVGGLTKKVRKLFTAGLSFNGAVSTNTIVTPPSGDPNEQSRKWYRKYRKRRKR